MTESQRLKQTGNKAANSNGYVANELNQAKNGRGGGVNGLNEIDLAKEFCWGKRSGREGATKTKLSCTGGNSSFSFSNGICFFCSVFFAATMALHRLQGWLPSNVCVTASWRDLVWRLSASIVVQATVCSSAQCALRVAMIVKTTKTLPSRTITNSS
jgi:hypothetical protein